MEKNLTIDYLLTTVSKSEKEILDIISFSKIKKGNILVGNQLSKHDEKHCFNVGELTISVYNMTSKGVSNNRNFLLSKSTAEYVTFLDDDMYFVDEMQECVEHYLSNSNDNAMRFNLSSDNPRRPIRFLNKYGNVGFRKLSRYGVCGIFFKREFLVNNNIFFDENIGPGTNINHGEDTVFLKNFSKFSKVFSQPLLCFRVKQSESTWQGASRNLELELFSHGYIYQRMYPKFSKFMAIAYLLTHTKDFPKKTKFSFLCKNMFLGIKKAKTDDYYVFH